MITFEYLEDYIEYIAGTRDKHNRTSTAFFCTPTVNLARYDKSVMNSFAMQLENKTGFTDRQAILAGKIVDKYRRQLAKQDVKVPADIDELSLRYPIREVDRTCSLFIEDEKIIAKFPYTTSIINAIKAHTHDHTGVVMFNKERKVWEIALTEPNLLWMSDVAHEFDFEVSDEIKALHADVLADSQRKYSIELMADGNGAPFIDNAPKQMIDYIQERIGSVSSNTLDNVAQFAGTLGFGIHHSIRNTILHVDFLESRSIRVEPTPEGIQKIVDFAVTHNKFPIFTYRPGMLGSEETAMLNSCFEDSEVMDLTKTKNKTDIEISNNTKVVHINSVAAKLLASESIDIPVLVIYNNLSFGAANEYVEQAAERTVFCCENFYEGEPF